MSCAVSGGLLAATRGASASHVTSWQGTRLLTTRGKAEGGKWFRERNGRKVLKLGLGSSGCYKFWRAPRPRPKPHRRRQRQQVKETLTVQLALSQYTTIASTATNAEVVIQVLQRSLSIAIMRVQVAEKSASTHQTLMEDLSLAASWWSTNVCALDEGRASGDTIMRGYLDRSVLERCVAGSASYAQRRYKGVIMHLENEKAVVKLKTKLTQKPRSVLMAARVQKGM